MSDKKRTVEQQGIKYFGFLCGQHQVLIRETDTHDKGIDAEIELSNSYTIGGNTPFLGVQVKSRTEARTLADGNFSISVTDQNIEYWSKYGRPIILVLFDIATQQIYWERVDKAQSKQINIKKSNTFVESSVGLWAGFCRDISFRAIQQTSLIEIEPVLASIGRDYQELLNPLKERLENFYESYKHKSFKEACRLIEPLADIYFESKAILANCALSFIQNNDRGALDYVSKLLEIDGIGPQEYATAAACLAHFDDFPNALPLFEKSLAELDCADTKNNYALALYRAGEFEKSQSVFLSLINSKSVCSKSLFNYALLMTAMYNYQESINAYERSIIEDPTNSDSYNNIALLFQALGMHECAFDAYESGLKNCSGDCHYLWINYARLLKDFGRDNEALEFYQKALKFHDEGSIWRDIALLYCRLGQTKQAEAIFTDHINSILGPVEETKDVYTAGVIDFGCEVQYMVRLELNSGRITVVELYNSNDQSLFNILRKVANESGIPFDLVKAEFFKDKVQKELQKISDHHRSQ